MPAPVCGAARQQAAAPTVPVPKVIGLQLTNALRILDQLKFGRGEISRVAHPEPSGQVIEQSPRVSARVAAGTRVNLVVSTGSQSSTDDVHGDQPAKVDSSNVPNLIGQTQLGAGILLAIAKLGMGSPQSVPDEENDGKVVRQFPGAGERVPRGTAVALWIGKSAPVPVPDLRDSSVAGAAEVLKSVGLKLGRIDSSLVVAGNRRIVRQQPAAQRSVSKGSAVRVWYGYSHEPVVAQPLPTPPRRVQVPSVVGNLIAHAIDILHAAELTPGPIDSLETNQPPGQVLSQRPKAGDSVPPTTRVTLQVAAQSKLVKVPSVRDSTSGGARAALERAGLQLGTVTEVPQPGGARRVISQAPLADATVLRGTTIAVRISVPPTAVTVPSVVGTRLSSARDTLLGSRLTVGTITEGTPTGADSTVVAQRPGAGASVAPLTAVDLTLATEKNPPPPQRAVPNVVSRGRSQADSLLRATGFSTGTITLEPSAAVGPDMVISQTPAAGTPADSGTAVTLRIATAPTQPRRLDPVPEDKWPSIWLIVAIAGGAIVVIGGGVAGVQGLKQHRVNQEWHKRVTFKAESLPGRQRVPDDADPLGGPAVRIGANPGKGSQEIIGAGPSIGESRT